MVHNTLNARQEKHPVISLKKLKLFPLLDGKSRNRIHAFAQTNYLNYTFKRHNSEIEIIQLNSA